MKIDLEIKGSISNVIGMYWDMELENAKEFYKENGTLEGHIFCDLVALDNLINNRDAKPEDYLEE
jgi:hypothetical protein